MAKTVTAASGRSRPETSPGLFRARPALLEQYRSLPLPSTQDEHWRFTDLEGFDPDSFAVDAAGIGTGRSSMLELETAGTAFASEAGIQIANAPDGVTFAPLDDHELLGTLVGVEDKFTAQNAALWQRGISACAVPGQRLPWPATWRSPGCTTTGTS